MMKTLSYDKEHDILALHKGFAKEESFKTNIDAGDLVLDVSTKGRVRGLEVMNASLFFKEFGITKRLLRSLTDADFSVRTRQNGVMLGLLLKTEEQEVPAKISVPM